MRLVERRPPLPLAAAFVAALILAVADVPILLASVSSARNSDFIQFYAAARLGLAHGWPAIYDTPRVMAVEVSSGGHAIGAFPYPPPAAWLAVPFTALPFGSVAVLVSALCFLLVLLACWWSTEGLRRSLRAGLLVGALGFYPVALTVGIGQLTALTMAILSGAAALLRRDKPGWAGTVLAALAVKPHLGILTIPGIAVAGRWKAALTAALLIAFLAALSLIAVGLGGARAFYKAAFGYGAGSPFSFGTLPVSMPLAAAIPAILATLTVTGLICWKSRQLGPDLPVAAGIVAGMMVIPHELIYDYCLLLLAGLLLLRMSPTGPVGAILAAAYALVELSNVFLVRWAFPIVLPVEAVLLLTMLLVSGASAERGYSIS